MARLFDGIDDDFRASIGANNYVGDLTLAAVVKLGSGRDAQWRNIITSLNSAGAPQGWSMEVDSGNHLEFSNLGTNDWFTTTTLSSSDGWILVAVTKATGSNHPRFHAYRYSDNSWLFHAAGNGGSAVANGTAPGASGFVNIGGDAGGSTDWFAGDIAVAGIWNSNLADAQIENLPFSLQAWFQVMPTGLWTFDQSATSQKVVDISGGGANESSLVGTSVSTNSVPLFNYFGDIVWVQRSQATGGGGFTPKFRKTLSGVGTGVGKRQIHGWA